jgi:hypothetical protein
MAVWNQVCFVGNRLEVDPFVALHRAVDRSGVDRFAAGRYSVVDRSKAGR